jgi:WD40 repeat protein
MNKELLDQLAPDEQSAALQLSSAAEEMHLSPDFQWKLETELMDAYTSNKAGKRSSSFMRFLVPVGWAILAVCGVLLLNWALRTLLPEVQVATGATPTPAPSFETSVRTGTVCRGPLAVAHGFDVFLSNPDKTSLVSVDKGKTIGELRSFAWSQDGKQLAILGNSIGRGNIYLMDATGSQLRPVLSNSELGYLMDIAWSRSGEEFVMWSVQNNKVLYLMNADGSGLVEKQLNVQILGTPKFAPDGLSVVFYGAEATSSGLFEMVLVDAQALLINSSVAGESSYAFSPDGSHLAYMEYDRDLGQARLVSEDLTARELAVLGTLPIPKGSGSSVPQTANMSWSADGKSIVFDVGRGAFDRVIYLAHTDGTGMLQVAEAGYAPAISSDGKCLAYIGGKKVYLLDFVNSQTSTPMLLADLPTGRAIADYHLDELQWKP